MRRQNYRSALCEAAYRRQRQDKSGLPTLLVISTSLTISCPRIPGGTTLNGNLSMQYERVCGHRGSSYDAFQANEVRSIPTHLLDAAPRFTSEAYQTTDDVISRSHPPPSELSI